MTRLAAASTTTLSSTGTEDLIRFRGEDDEGNWTNSAFVATEVGSGSA
jgi:hypothetical protein